MKRFIIIFSVVLLMTIAPYANAQSEFPQEILDLFESHYGTTDFDGLFFFDMPDGSRLCVMHDASGRMDINRSTDERHEDWVTEEQISPFDGTWEPRQIGFVRHDPLTPRADGSFYPDELGFDLVCEETGRQISYHYNGTTFEICGWKNPREYHGEAILNGTMLSFYPSGTTVSEYSTMIGVGFESIMTDYEDLPYTPDEAKRRTALVEETIRNYYPGYTLFSCYMDSYQTEARAEYYKIEDNRLYVIRAEFSSAEETPYSYECMPIPLSQSFIDRLETENISGLLDLKASMDLLLTEDVLNTIIIPMHGKVINSHLQDQALILLLENNGKRYIHIVEEDDWSYSVQTTKPLPDGAYLDLFHSGNGDIQIEWQDSEGKYRTACYSRRADGVWQLSWTMNSGENTEDFSFIYCGIEWEYNHRSSNDVYFGSMPDLSLMNASVEQVPRNRAELMPFVDRSEWAVVNNPDPADRLHLRTEPKRDAQSLGKFYNRTPVKVLQTKGDWCKVQIGADGYLIGWMMKKYLAFGDQMDAVDCTFPDKVFVDGYENCSLYDTMELKKHHSASGEYWIVGVVEDELYIIVTTNGESGYVPQEWLWEGRG